jgi:UDP-2,3-diacylglucosamine pyrophosphatase LpxH
MMNAVEYARENHYQAVACGHIHCIEDEIIDGIRYLNTGSWTEKPLCWLEVTDTELNLREMNGTKDVQSGV